MSMIAMISHVHVRSLPPSISLVLLGADACLAVGDLDVELSSTLDDLDALARRHVVGDLGSIGAVLHHQHLELLHVGHEELLEAVGHKMAGLLVGAIANVGHGNLALEATTDTVVNTLWLPPAGLETRVEYGWLIIGSRDQLLCGHHRSFVRSRKYLHRHGGIGPTGGGRSAWCASSRWACGSEK